MVIGFIFSTMPGKGKACVQRYWFCRSDYSKEKNNELSVCKKIEYRAIIIIFGPTRYYLSPTQKSALKF